MKNRRVTRIRALLIIACGGLAAGCDSHDEEPVALFEPSVQEITVTNFFHREPATVSVLINNPGGSDLRVENVRMGYRAVDDPPDTYLPDGEIELSGSGNNYSGQLPPLSLGDYEVRVTAVFGLRPTPENPTPQPGPNRFKEGTEAFTVVPGDLCLRFPTPDVVAQWSFSGFVDTTTEEVRCEGALAFTEQGGGNASVPVSLACVNPAGESFYRFDIISPDISDREDFQQDKMTGVYIVAAGGPLNRIQPIIRTDADRTFAAIDPQGEFAFQPIGGPNFQAVTMNFGELPDDETIVEIRVRAFGDVEAGSSALEGFFHLNTICPIL